MHRRRLPLSKALSEPPVTYPSSLHRLGVHIVNGLRTFRRRRFQKKQYADVAIVQTEKKGFGLRAEVELPEYGFSHLVGDSSLYSACLCRDAFIYEYVGEVVKEPEFLKRMGRYAQEGIRHFYFMMLQKEQVKSRKHLRKIMVADSPDLVH